MEETLVEIRRLLHAETVNASSLPSPKGGGGGGGGGDDGGRGGGGAVAAALRHLSTQPATTRHAVAAALVLKLATDATDAVAAESEWNLLSGMLQLANQRLETAEEGEGDATIATALGDMLVAYAKRLATELTQDAPAGDQMKMLVVWADTVVEMASKVAVVCQSETNANAPTQPWVVQLAQEFFRIHQHSQANRLNFRLMTLVWKSLIRLSTVYRAELLHARASSPSTDAPDPPATFSYATLFDAAATSLAQMTQRLRGWRGRSGADQEIARDLKLQRLFLRAFQGQFIQFVDAMVAQVECGVALAVDAIAAVIPIAEGFTAQSETAQHEASRVLQCAVALVEMMAKSDKLQASTRSFVGTQLWQPFDKMASLVAQTRSQHVDSDEHEGSACEELLRYGHLLAVAAFSAIHASNEGSLPTAESSTSFDKDLPVLGSVGELFARFRDVGSRTLVARFTRTKSILVDVILDSLVAHAESIEMLQLFLLEQTLHPDPTQRFLLWELWRELMCFVWEDEIALGAFHTLFRLSYTKCTDGFAVDDQARDEILRLLAYLYPELSGAIKREYLNLVSTPFDTVCSEGPAHKHSAKMAATLDLLEMLSSALLIEYNETNKEDWVAEYFPVAVNCVGGVHEFVDRGELITVAEKTSVIRMLDTALLIVRAIFEDNDESEMQGAHGLGGMLLPMCTETLTHLAKLSLAGSGGKPPRSWSKSFARALESCLFLLTKLSPLMKLNHSNQCVQVIKDLLSVLLSDHELTAHSVAIVVFVRDALGDLCVAPSDADIVWKMLGRLLHKLSALHFGLQVDPATQPLTPPQSVFLEALYTLFARSNLPEFATSRRNFKAWIVPHAQPRFATFLQGVCEGSPETLKTFHMMDFSKIVQRFEETYARRFQVTRIPTPSAVNQPSKKRDRDQINDAAGAVAPPHPVSGEDVDMDGEIENAKRIKWDVFAAAYWQLHDSLASLSSPDRQEAFIDELSETDLDQATSALQNLLTKSTKSA